MELVPQDDDFEIDFDKVSKSNKAKSKPKAQTKPKNEPGKKDLIDEYGDFDDDFNVNPKPTTEAAGKPKEQSVVNKKKDDLDDDYGDFESEVEPGFHPNDKKLLDGVSKGDKPPQKGLVVSTKPEEVPARHIESHSATRFEAADRRAPETRRQAQGEAYRRQLGRRRLRSRGKPEEQRPEPARQKSSGHLRRKGDRTS